MRHQSLSPLFAMRDGPRLDNITDWALNSSAQHYEPGKEAKAPITKDAIFHYVYGVLHDPSTARNTR